MKRIITPLIFATATVLCCASQSRAQSVPAFVQSKFCSGTSSQVCTFDTDNTLHNTIIAISSCTQASGPCSIAVADTQGNTYAAPVCIGNLRGSNTICMAEADNVAAGANVVTITVTGSSGGDGAIVEYFGLATPAYDRHASDGSSGAVTAMDTGVTPAISYTNELVLATLAGNSHEPCTVTGYTSRLPASTGNQFFDEIDDKNVSSAGTQTGSCTAALATGYFAAIFTFKANGSPPVPPPPRLACGLQDDTTRTVALNYAAAADPSYTGTFFAPPNVVGTTFTDTLSACSIKQLTYGFSQYGKAMRHEYSNMSAINSNDTLIELQDSSGVWSITDLSGGVIVPAGNVPWSSGTGGRWNATDPLTIYYVVQTQAKIYKGVIPTNYAACAPACTITPTLLHDFSATYIADNDGFNLPGEGDIQIDTPNVLVLCGIQLGGTEVGVCEASAGTVDVFEYNFVTDTVGTKLHLTGTPAVNFDNAQLTPDGRVMIDWDAGSESPCVSGPCFYGVELYDASMNWVSTPWVHGSSHTKEVAFGGHNYLVLADTGPYVCAQQGVVRVDIDSLVQTCILSLLPWNASIHVGGAENGNGWLIIDHVDYESPGAASYTLAANWDQDVQSNGAPSAAGYWGTYTGEEILLMIDGSSIYRMTWNRSRPNGGASPCVGSCYWKQPRSSISRDGKYVVFDSDYGQGVNTPASDYTDVFLIATAITSGGGAVGASLAPGTKASPGTRIH